MIQLGVSLYPEQETPQQIEDYLKLAKSFGFSKVFTSLFSVEGTKEEIVSYFKGLTSVAHKYGMEVYGDCNARFFMEMGASPDDLSIFKEIGLDVLRLDLMFNDERDVAIVNNKEGLGVQLNASLIPAVKRVLELGGDRSRIIGSYNFYPLRNTGASSEDVMEANRFFKEEGMKTQIFISQDESCRSLISGQRSDNHLISFYMPVRDKKEKRNNKVYEYRTENNSSNIQIESESRMFHFIMLP